MLSRSDLTNIDLLRVRYRGHGDNMIFSKPTSFVGSLMQEIRLFLLIRKADVLESTINLCDYLNYLRDRSKDIADRLETNWQSLSEDFTKLKLYCEG
jgi:hypothetical protein